MTPQERNERAAGLMRFLAEELGSKYFSLEHHTIKIRLAHKSILYFLNEDVIGEVAAQRNGRRVLTWCGAQETWFFDDHALMREIKRGLEAARATAASKTDTRTQAEKFADAARSMERTRASMRSRACCGSWRGL